MTNQCIQPIRPKTFKTLSSGEKLYRYGGILAKPKAVLLDRKGNSLFIIDQGLQSLNVSMTDALNARLAAYVVSHVEKSRFRRRAIRLYVAVGDRTQVEIDPELHDTRRLVAQWQAHRRRDNSDFRWIPTTALAMALTQNTWLSHPPMRGM